MDTISELEYNKHIEQGRAYKGYVIGKDGTKAFVNLQVLKQAPMSIAESEQNNLRGNSASNALTEINNWMFWGNAGATAGQYSHPVNRGMYYNSKGVLTPIKGGLNYNWVGDVQIPDNLKGYSRDAKWALRNFNNWGRFVRGTAYVGIVIESVNVGVVAMDSNLSQEEKNAKYTKSGVNIAFSAVSFADPWGAAASIVYFSVDIIFADKERDKGGWEVIHDKVEDSFIKFNVALENWVWSWFYRSWGF